MTLLVPLELTLVSVSRGHEEAPRRLVSGVRADNTPRTLRFVAWK